MQCSFRLETDGYSGNTKMKTVNNFKNTYRKEANLDSIVDQLAIRLQDIKDKEVPPVVGMPTCSVEQAEAVRRYYAAFPALKKGDESPLQYYMPPPAWCRNNKHIEHQLNMQSEPASLAKEWNVKFKKFPTGKERRNSYHGQRKNGKKRCNSYSRSLESKDSVPEWVTSEGVWDMETQDPVREFIRAIALDEGYGTADHTLAEDVRCVPQWDAPPRSHWLMDPIAPPDPDPVDTELYAKFEAKFDRSLEALWDAADTARIDDQNTPIDDYQELPIDFAELLSSPSDRMFGGGPPAVGLPPPFYAHPPDAFASLSSLTSLPSLPSLTDSVWAAEVPRPSPPLHDRFRPLNLTSPAAPLPPPPPPPPPPELESFALLEGEELYDALTTVASTLRSFTAINHSRDTSGFAEVPPRRHTGGPSAPPPGFAEPPRRAPDAPKEDLLTSQRTHFRPIRREGSAEAPRYADGDTFDIRGSLEPVEFRRSSSGGAFLCGGERYLEYRAGSRSRGIDYTRLALTVAQRTELAALPLRFAVRQHDAAVQTEPPAPPSPPPPPAREHGVAAKKMRSVEMERSAGGEGGEGGEGGGMECVATEPPRDWEELLADIRLAHAAYAADGAAEGGAPADRKRRHSAARQCAHPHARFLPCCAHLRPLTR